VLTGHGESSVGLTAAVRRGRDADISSLVSAFNTPNDELVSASHGAVRQCPPVRPHPTNVGVVASVAIDNTSERDVTADRSAVAVWVNVYAQPTSAFTRQITVVAPPSQSINQSGDA